MRPGIYTVIGFWESTGQTYAGFFAAGDAQEAMSLCAHGVDFADGFAIIGAIHGGEFELVPPSDAGNLAYACDIPEPDYEAISRRQG